jgi:FkbM family methyltransferase
MDLERANVFGDPIPGIEKKIYIEYDDGRTEIFDSGCPIDIEITKDMDIPLPSHELIHNIIQGFKDEELLQQIHSHVIFCGNRHDEYQEQLMACKFISPDAKVLEIGANIGRNTVVIASILKDDTNLVTLETMTSYIPTLENHREKNGFHFHIVNAALSKRRLAQKYNDWISYPIAPNVILGPHEFEPPIVSFEQLEQQFHIQFDTLVLDCEGAFYYILQDFPSILDNIRLIIMENDYIDLRHKEFVDERLVQSGFHRIHVISGGWGPCESYFYEAWSR